MQNQKTASTPTPSRRNFLAASVAGAAPLILPNRLFAANKTGQAPSNKINIAAVGIGGMGRTYLHSMESENIVALCDVDDAYSAKTYAAYPQAKRYRDFGDMLANREDIDAVVIGTPDHSHAAVTMAALKAGKHVYCAKPLTRTIHECRVVTEAAKKAGVATQMSIQMNASREHRVMAEWIKAGAIGTVQEVHIWSNRPIWPQGIDRPAETPDVPKTLDWKRWLGPAPTRPYHSAYLPFKWRGWWDFGAGALGDMGCHGFDPVFRALGLTAPTTVEASSTPVNDETAPLGSIVRYHFPTSNDHGSVKLTWYDGGLRPERPKELEANRSLGDPAGGILFVGDEGKIIAGALGGGPRIIPDAAMSAFKRPKKSIPRSDGHYEEFIAACKGGPKAGAHFGYGGPLTEAVLLGNLAIRSGKSLTWDAASMATNDADANKFIKEAYHNGWTL